MGPHTERAEARVHGPGRVSYRKRGGRQRQGRSGAVAASQPVQTAAPWGATEAAPRDWTAPAAGRAWTSSATQRRARVRPAATALLQVYIFCLNLEPFVASREGLPYLYRNFHLSVKGEENFLMSAVLGGSKNSIQKSMCRPRRRSSLHQKSRESSELENGAY